MAAVMTTDAEVDAMFENRKDGRIRMEEMAAAVAKLTAKEEQAVGHVYQYKYITFSFGRVSESGRTSVWTCRNAKSGTILGTVAWYGPWRQYCFYPSSIKALVFSAGCLQDIQHFLAMCQKEHGK